MAIALVAHVKAKSAAGNPITTGAIDTTGANLIVVTGSDFSGGALSLTDSKGNAYTGLTPTTEAGSSCRIKLWYCLNPLVGSGHTFSYGSGTTYCEVNVSAWSGAHASSVFDGESAGNTGASATSLTPATYTPSQDNCLVVSGWTAALTAPDSASVGGGFTLVDVNPGVTGTSYGGALASLIQTTAAAANPSLSWTTAANCVARSAAFRAAAATGGNPWLTYRQQAA